MPLSRFTQPIARCSPSQCHGLCCPLTLTSALAHAPSSALASPAPCDLAFFPFPLPLWLLHTAMKQLVKAYPNLAATLLLGAVRRLAEASQHADPDLDPCGAGAGPSLTHEQGQGQGHGWVQNAAEEQEHGSRRVGGQKGSRKRSSSASGGQAPEPSSAAPAPAAPPQLVGPSMAPGLGVWLWAPQGGAYGEGDAAAAWRRERLPAWERWALTLLPRSVAV